MSEEYNGDALATSESVSEPLRRYKPVKYYFTLSRVCVRA